MHLERLADYFEISVDSLLDREERTINVDLQNTSFLNDYSLILDDKPLNQHEMAEFVSFIQVKRLIEP